MRRAFYEELFLLAEFKWFDYSRSAVAYALETLCEAVLFASAAYYTSRLIKFINMRKKESKSNEKID